MDKVIAGSYKVKIRNIFPRQAKMEVNTIPKAYLGISMNNPSFWHHSFIFVLRWMSENVESPYLLVGDYLNRWNEQIFTSNPPDECACRSIQQGDQLLQTYATELQTRPISVFRWKELMETEEFEPAKKEIETAFELSPIFRSLLVQSTRKFIQNQTESGNKLTVSPKQAHNFSISYLIEELAVFLVLIRKGINVQMYPGLHLPVLAQLHKPEKLHLPKEFQNGVFVGLRIKKR